MDDSLRGYAYQDDEYGVCVDQDAADAMGVEGYGCLLHGLEKLCRGRDHRGCATWKPKLQMRIFYGGVRCLKCKCTLNRGIDTRSAEPSAYLYEIGAHINRFRP